MKVNELKICGVLKGFSLGAFGDMSGNTLKDRKTLDTLGYIDEGVYIPDMAKASEKCTELLKDLKIKREGT